jgi:hypothetical protein
VDNKALLAFEKLRTTGKCEATETTFVADTAKVTRVPSQKHTSPTFTILPILQMFPVVV